MISIRSLNINDVKTHSRLDKYISMNRKRPFDLPAPCHQTDMDMVSDCLSLEQNFIIKHGEKAKNAAIFTQIPKIMIWIIGGTSDANEIARKLIAHAYKTGITATSSYGERLALETGCCVKKGKMDSRAMQDLFAETITSYVIDASHPYAEEVSRNAIEACKTNKTKYLRFERETTIIQHAKYYATYEELVAGLIQTTGNIFLTTGSNNLHRFSSIPAERIIARVLAVTDSIMKCESAGIPAHNIIASKGRFSEEANYALMKEYEIKHLVSKDSGVAGGLIEKTNAALQLGIMVHILKKPQIDYPQKYSSIDELVKYIEKQFR